MTAYSYDQLKSLWIQNGGSPMTADIAAAVGLAESSGRSDAVSAPNRNGSRDWGIWQINNGGQQTLDPNYNARVAIQMSKNGTNWRPWCTAYSDNACGTKGGTYQGPGSAFLRYLKGGSSTPAATTNAAPPAVPVSTSTTPIPNATGTPSATNVGTKAGGKSDDDCLIRLPGVGLFGINLVGGWCVISRSQGRAVLGATTMAAGGLITLVGLGLILAGSKAGRAVEGLIPNPVSQLASKAGGSRKAAPRPRPDADDRRYDELAARRAELRRARSTGRSVSMDDVADGRF